MKDPVSRPSKTTGKIIVLDFLIFIFLDTKVEDKKFYAEWNNNNHFQNLF